MPVNIHTAGTRRDYPAWNTRVKIHAVDADGNLLENEFDFGGEVFERSPRFIRGGHTFRLRPTRPLAVLAALAHKLGFLPALLTPEEAASDWGKELLVPLWDDLRVYFENLASPLAEKDTTAEPGPVTGWSFTMLQVLCKVVGETKSAPTPRPSSRPTSNGVSPQQLEAARRKIEEMRSRAATNGTTPTTPTTSKKKKGGAYDPNALLATIEEAAKTSADQPAQ